MNELRTLPKGRPLTWLSEIETVRALVRVIRSGHAVTVKPGLLPEGALSYALLSPAERAKRSEEYSETVKELVRAMECKK